MQPNNVAINEVLLEEINKYENSQNEDPGLPAPDAEGIVHIKAGAKEIMANQAAAEASHWQEAGKSSSTKTVKLKVESEPDEEDKQVEYKGSARKNEKVSQSRCAV